MRTTWPRRRGHAARALLLVLLALAVPACGRETRASPSRPVPAWMEERSGVLRVLRSQGIEWCRGLVAASAPGSGSRRSILLRIARELGADSSDPRDIAALVGRDLAGPNAAPAPVDAATEGCLLGLQQGLDGLRP